MLPSGPHFIIMVISMANFRSIFFSIIQILRMDKYYTGKVLHWFWIAFFSTSCDNSDRPNNCWYKQKFDISAQTCRLHHNRALHTSSMKVYQKAGVHKHDKCLNTWGIFSGNYVNLNVFNSIVFAQNCSRIGW